MCQLNNHLVQKNRLTSHQSGNRKLHSTEALSLLATDHIFRAMGNKQIITVMVLIDLSKAIGVTHAVPQGSILGPMFFSLYMNDLPGVTKFSNIESYVDDTKIYLSSSAQDVHSCLHQISQDLELVAGWCCANQLLINPEKRNLVLFGTRQLVSKLPHFTVPFLGQELTPASSAKDLGIILDSNLTFTEHISTVPSSLLSSLCQISRVRHLFTKDVLNIILNYLIFSKLFYCSTVWSGTFKQNIKKLQLIQNFASRILTNTRKYDHISPILHELGWFTVKKTAALAGHYHDL